MGPDHADLEYHVVDVFTDIAFAGNPLAVVLGSDDLSTEQLQALAREFHLSETAFPQRPSDAERSAGADYRLRIFTPEVELPFAGHPSVGTAWLLHRIGRLPEGTVRQACGAGLLPLHVGQGGDAVTLTAGEPLPGPATDPAEALAAVGLATGDLLGPEPAVASAGLAYVVLPVQVEALRRAEPDLARLRRLFRYPQEATGVYLVAWDDPSLAPSQVRARMFAGDVGVAEDAATGSAAVAFGAWLPGAYALADGPHRIDVVQGVEMGRPSRLLVDVDVVAGSAREVRVTGQVVPVASGRVAVPPHRVGQASP